ncbi:MAG: hypothetical protein GF317_10865 [Candidatus Lokiarchaeota archaeon]|nr:hypothetical protein [Candidatus Lokiarchaeota archaeon]MBD3200163.1 hypothetical protein [Candidatus Lokiarchaeota archaeon]
MNMTDFEILFNPRAVGIIGVNDKPYGGGYFLTCLKAIGFDRDLYLFNPRLKGQTIKGCKVYGSILEIPEDKPIDYVILAVPAELCPKIMEEIGQKGVPFVTIFTSGFSEVGREDLEEAILKTAFNYNIRLIGPNCLGVYNPDARLAVSRWQIPESGSFGFISQSGGLSIDISNTAIYRFRTFISKVISVGNQIDLKVRDFLDYLREDDKTKVIGIYLENLKETNGLAGREFKELLLQTSLKKPVILWKVGFGTSTKEAIMSHTGGLAGSYKIWSDMAKQTGTILVHSSQQLITIAAAFNHLKFNKIDRNLGIIAVGGGSSIEMTDLMEFNGLSVPKLNETTKATFKSFLPDVNTIIRNPLDLGGDGLSPETFGKSLITLANDPGISVIVFSKSYYFNEAFIESILRAKKQIDKPIICVAPTIREDLDFHKEKLFFKQKMLENGILVLESIDITAKVLKKMYDYKKFLIRRKKL